MNVPKTIEYFMQTEQTAAEILETKQLILELNKRANETREALGFVTKSNQDTCYMYQGTLLIKQPQDIIKTKLKQDFKELNEEIRTQGERIKLLVFKLQDMEKQQPYTGKNLIPLERGELQALSQVWGK